MTAAIIAECVSSARVLEEISLVGCAISTELFSELLSSQGTGDPSSLRYSFLNKPLKRMEINSNKIANQGLQMMKQHLQTHCLNGSLLEYINMQDIELEGSEAA